MTPTLEHLNAYTPLGYEHRPSFGTDLPLGLEGSDAVNTSWSYTQNLEKQ